MFTGVKVFSASMYEDRKMLGERVTEWLRARAGTIEIVDIVQRQSSDASYHMVSITLFYCEPGKASIAHAIQGPGQMKGQRKVTR